MGHNPNDVENTVPYPPTPAEHLREEAEKDGSLGYNEQISASRMRGEAVRHGSLGANEQIDAKAMRAEAHSKGHTNEAEHRRHEREIARLDHKAGKEKGGR